MSEDEFKQMQERNRLENKLVPFLNRETELENLAQINAKSFNQKCTEVEKLQADLNRKDELIASANLLIDELRHEKHVTINTEQAYQIEIADLKAEVATLKQERDHLKWLNGDILDRLDLHKKSLVDANLEIEDLNARIARGEP